MPYYISCKRWSFTDHRISYPQIYNKNDNSHDNVYDNSHDNVKENNDDYNMIFTYMNDQNYNNNDILIYSMA